MSKRIKGKSIKYLIDKKIPELFFTEIEITSVISGAYNGYAKTHDGFKVGFVFSKPDIIMLTVGRDSIIKNYSIYKKIHESKKYLK